MNEYVRLAWKAIGTSYDIFIQFLAEAVVISLLGGLLGLIFSVGLLSIARDLIPVGENISLFPISMCYGFFFSSFIGLASDLPRTTRLTP